MACKCEHREQMCGQERAGSHGLREPKAARGWPCGWEIAGSHAVREPKAAWGGQLCGQKEIPGTDAWVKTHLVCPSLSLQMTVVSAHVWHISGEVPRWALLTHRTLSNRSKLLFSGTKFWGLSHSVATGHTVGYHSQTSDLKGKILPVESNTVTNLSDYFLFGDVLLEPLFPSLASLAVLWAWDADEILSISFPHGISHFLSPTLIWFLTHVLYLCLFKNTVSSGFLRNISYS